MENLFFDLSKLKKCGRGVIIGVTVRIRYPELVEIGDNVIIDDFTYISTRLIIEDNVHIAAGCKFIGGRSALVKFNQFSTVSPNVVLAAGSDDYIGGLATPIVSSEYKGSPNIGTIEIGKHSIVGANSVVLPNVKFNEGSALGALSLAKRDLSAWGLYAGVPAKRIKQRDKATILQMERKFRARVENAE